MKKLLLFLLLIPSICSAQLIGTFKGVRFQPSQDTVALNLNPTSWPIGTVIREIGTDSLYMRYNTGFWGPVGGGSGGGGSPTPPAGNDTEVQYNNAGAFGAEAAFNYIAATNTLGVDNVLAPGTLTLEGTTGLVVSPNNSVTDYLQYTAATGIATLTDQASPSPLLTLANTNLDGEIEIRNVGTEIILDGGTGDVTNKIDFVITATQGGTVGGSDIEIRTPDGNSGQNAGNITIQPGAAGTGNAGFLILNNLPTTCVGAPTGALANVAGTLTICP